MDTWVIVVICLAVLLLISMIMVVTRPIKYYPSIGLYRVPAVSTIRTTATNIPSGFTFVSNWSFDPKKTAGPVTLSNNNLTATSTSTGTNYGVLIGNQSLSGKQMFSVSMVYSGTPENNSIGLSTNYTNSDFNSECAFLISLY